jgi:predicted DNA-binding transcriptional regulator AlpA
MLLTEKQVAEILSVSVRALQRWRAVGGGPPFVRVGPRFVRYEAAEISAFVASGRAPSFAAERARVRNDA